MSAGRFSWVAGVRAGALLLALVTSMTIVRADAADDVPGDQSPALIEQPVVTQPQGDGRSLAEKRRFQLKPTSDGGYTYNGPDFAARVAPDGSVSFARPGVQLSPASTDPAVVGIDAVTPQPPISGDIPPAIESLPGFRFDATDEIMRVAGDDPARLGKAAFLASTFEMRVKMAARWNHAQNEAALAELPSRLDQLWHDERLTPVERRHVLLAMWSELIPGAGGDAARAIIRKFADEHLTPAEADQFR